MKVLDDSRKEVQTISMLHCTSKKFLLAQKKKVQGFQFRVDGEESIPGHFLGGHAKAKVH